MAAAAAASSGVQVVLLVPYRAERRQNREHHLAHFLHVMPGILNSAIGFSRWAILVGEQSADGQKFSRARCLNAVARIACSKYPGAILVLHDVDLIPDVERARGFLIPPPPHGVTAFNADSSKYGECAMYIGGICSIAAETFQRVNGFQNTFQGWGGEDDCFRDAIRLRFNERGLGTDAWLETFTKGTVTDLEESDSPELYKRACNVPEFRCEKAVKIENRRIARETDFRDGVAQLVFEVVRVRNYELPGACAEDPASSATLLTLNLFVKLFPGWHMAMSKTRNMPYYYRILNGESTYLFQGDRTLAAPPGPLKRKRSLKEEAGSKATLFEFCGFDDFKPKEA